jgi:hypothetical protein
MAFTLISQNSGTNATTLASGGTQTYSSLTLGTTSNLASTFVAVAIAAGRFGSGSGITVNTCTIGATSLYPMDNGTFYDALGSTQYGVVMYGGWITAAPSNNTLSVNWTNNTLGTTALSVCAMSFTGTASTATTSASVALRSAGGLIDGGTFTTAGTWGAARPITTSGGVTTVGSITNNNVLIAGQQVYIAGSNIITAGSYTIVGSTATSISFLGTFSGTESSTLALYYANTFGNGFGGSNNFDYYNTGGFVTGINPGLTAPYATTVPTSYGSQKQPWVAAYITSEVYGISQLRSSSALITIDTSRNVTSAGSATGTVVTTGTISALSPTASSGFIPTPNGNMVFSYTGVSGTTLTGCTVATAPSSNIVCPQYVSVYIPSATGHGIVGVLPTASATSSASSGLANGDSSPTLTSQNAFPQIQMASPATNRLIMFGGYNAGGAKITTAVGALRIGAGTPSGRGLLYTFVPATRTQTDLASATATSAGSTPRGRLTYRLTSAVQTIIASTKREYLRQRMTQAISVFTSSAFKAKLSKRNARAVRVSTAKATRTKSSLRNALASQIQASRGLRAVSRRKSANATQVVAATVTRRTASNRFGQAVSVYAIGSTKRTTRVRRALAGLVGAARALVSVFIISHPGTVSVGFIVPSVKVGVQSPSVDVDMETPSVLVGTSHPSVSVDTMTASVSINAKFKPET